MEYVCICYRDLLVMICIVLDFMGGRSRMRTRFESAWSLLNTGRQGSILAVLPCGRVWKLPQGRFWEPQNLSGYTQGRG